eukprot:387559-Rhodomonas_salina.1
MWSSQPGTSAPEAGIWFEPLQRHCLATHPTHYSAGSDCRASHSAAIQRECGFAPSSIRNRVVQGSFSANTRRVN